MALLLFGNSSGGGVLEVGPSNQSRTLRRRLCRKLRQTEWGPGKKTHQILAVTKEKQIRTQITITRITILKAKS